MTELLSGRLKARLAAGDTIGLIWLSLGHAAIVEMAAHAGADALVLDLQHGLWDRAGFEAATGASAWALPTLARVAENTPLAIGSALDAGIDGVLVPMVETAAQAAAAVAAARFPPLGHRSGGGVRPLAMGFDSYLRKAGSILVGVMIETAAGVDDAQAIAATQGLDFVFIGTGDLAISYGFDKNAVEAACLRVKTICANAGIACGIFTPDIGRAVQSRAEGYRLVVLANDIDAVGNAFSSAAKHFAEPA